MVLIADRDFEYLRDTQIAVVLDNCISWKSLEFASDADWWRGTRFDQLIEDEAIVLVRKHLGFDDDGSSIVGHKIGLFRIGNVRRGGSVLSFDIAERLKCAVE